MAPRRNALLSLPNAVVLRRVGDVLRRWHCSSLPTGRLWRLLTATEQSAPDPLAGPVWRGSATVRPASSDSRGPDSDLTSGTGEAGPPSAAAGETHTPAKRTSKGLGRRREHATASPSTSSGDSASSAAGPGPGPGLLSVLGAMAGLFRAGVGGSGLGVGQAAFGLQALSRLHEEQRLADHPTGRVLGSSGPSGHPSEGDGGGDGGGGFQAEAERLLDALELAHGAYRKSAAALAATTCLRAPHVRTWRPEGGSLQPGYFIAVDHFGRRVVWGVRGTRVFSDVLMDLAMAAHPLGAGTGHWGMTHAAHWMLQREAARVAALLRSLGGPSSPSSSPGGPGPYRLQLVGHSLGGSVAALATVMLRERLVEAARSAAIPPELVSCVAFAPAACMSPPLAEQSRSYITSVVLNNDIVPRFNAVSLARLQEELRGVDWYSELQRTLMQHTLVKSLSNTLDALTPATLASSEPSATTALPPPPPQAAPQGEAPSPPLPAGAGAAPASASAGTSGGGASAASAAAAAVVQQFSAAVLESAAFKSAVQSLDEWKARAVAAAGGEQAEAAMRRQLELVQAWLQDVAAAKRSETTAQPSGQGPGEDGGGGGGGSGSAADAAADVRRAAEAAAERLRQGVESAMASLTAAAVASRDRLSASLPSMASMPALPSLPSLPQPHELPLVEATAAEAAAAAAATPVAERGGGAVDASLWGGASAAEVAGEAGLPVAAVDAAVASSSGQELPLLLPPGRILYIRPQQDEPPSAYSSSFSAEACSRRDMDGGAASASSYGPSGGSPASASVQSSRGAGYVVLELPPGAGFKRLILARSALDEHRCRAYRRVLMQLAFREAPGL